MYLQDKIIANAEGLDGEGSTDIAKIWIWGKDFDDFEIILED